MNFKPLVIASVIFFFAATDLYADNDLSPALQNLYQEFSHKFESVPTKTVVEFLSEPHRRNWILVDAREEKEQAVSMLPDAVTLRTFSKNVEEYEEKNVLIYCTIGYRSAVATQKLVAENIKAFNLVGGILAWIEAGETLVDAEELPTKEVHVYGKKWNVVPMGYKARF